MEIHSSIVDVRQQFGSWIVSTLVIVEVEMLDPRKEMIFHPFCEIRCLVSKDGADAQFILQKGKGFFQMISIIPEVC